MNDKVFYIVNAKQRDNDIPSKKNICIIEKTKSLPLFFLKLLI
jgi:hypothetical protein